MCDPHSFPRLPPRSSSPPLPPLTVLPTTDPPSRHSSSLPHLNLLVSPHQLPTTHCSSFHSPALNSLPLPPTTQPPPSTHSPSHYSISLPPLTRPPSTHPPSRLSTLPPLSPSTTAPLFHIHSPLRLVAPLCTLSLSPNSTFLCFISPALTLLRTIAPIPSPFTGCMRQSNKSAHSIGRIEGTVLARSSSA